MLKAEKEMTNMIYRNKMWLMTDFSVVIIEVRGSTIT